MYAFVCVRINSRERQGNHKNIMFTVVLRSLGVEGLGVFGANGAGRVLTGFVPWTLTANQPLFSGFVFRVQGFGFRVSGRVALN